MIGGPGVLLVEPTELLFKSDLLESISTLQLEALTKGRSAEGQEEDEPVRLEVSLWARR